MDILWKHKFLVLVIIIEIVTLPILLFALQQKQQQITSAQKSTVLFFNPETSTNSPLSKNLGENFSLDLIVSPANNLVSIAKLEITFDPDKVVPDSENPVAVNYDVFPDITEGPIIQDGKIFLALSVGPNLAKIIQKESKALSLNFRTLNPAEKTEIGFGDATALYSVSNQDSNSENVLSGTNPAIIQVKNALTSNNNPVISKIKSPTLTPTPTPKTLPKPSPIPTKSLDLNTYNLSKTILYVKSLKLHGIGTGGDNASEFSAGNPDPITTTRSITVEIYNISEKLIAKVKGSIIYDSENGDFNGSINIPDNLPNGNYILKIKINQYLKKQLPGLINIVQGQIITPASISLIAGDVNDDNKLNSEDYNIILGCYSDFAPAKNCNERKKLAADINDDGNVNQVDYNLYLREISAISGE